MKLYTYSVGDVQVCVCLSALADDDVDDGDDCGWYNDKIYSRQPFVICTPVCVCLHLKYLSQNNISIIGTVRYSSRLGTYFECFG